MTKYLVTWEEAIIHAVHIEAESEQDALDKFDNNNYDWQNVETIDSVGIVENSIEVEEV
jgi:hypothetical protein